MKKYAAELIGTFGIIFFGTGSVIVNTMSPNAITSLGVPLTFGVVVAVMIYSLAEISGGHFNPAVTIGSLGKTRMPFMETIAYLISQISGALLASLLLHVLFPSSTDLGATVPSGSQSQSFILEVLLMFFLMLVILQTTHYGSTRALTSVIIGGTVCFEALVAGRISGASMNPARSIGPAVISGRLDSLWIYLLAPVAGALLATLMHNSLVLQETA